MALLMRDQYGSTEAGATGATLPQVSQPPKRNRTCLSFKTKMEIIRRVSAGESASSLSRFYQVNESSIRTILKNSDKIKATVANSNPLSVGLTSRLRSPLVMRMEKKLTEWIVQEESKSSSISSVAIREKALSLFRVLQKETASNESFAASKGWYHKFSIRLRHLNSKKQNNQLDNDSVLASMYWDELKKAITAKGYIQDQIFNIYETSLFWKRMPARAYNDSVLNIRSAKENVTLLLSNNISGTFKCKPLIVYSSEYVDNLKDKRSLSAYMKSNRTGRMTIKIFEDWFLNCFCVEVERYCKASQIDFQGILILDNAHGYPTHLTNLHPNIRVLFLPMDIMRAIQPMYQAMVFTFKLNYLKWVFSQMADASNDHGESRVSQFLSSYNILHAIGNIILAWNEHVSATMINNVWDMLYKDGICYVTANMKFINETLKMSEILNLCKVIGGEGFGDIHESDLIDLLESENHPAIESTKEPETEQEEYKESANNHKDMSLEQLSHLFSTSEKLVMDVIRFDPNMERSVNFGKCIKKALSVYRKKYQDKLMENIITNV